jgi:UDP-N-acetylmuramoyl-tripeptide--D-alanyl-D-alanine ligase
MFKLDQLLMTEDYQELYGSLPLGEFAPSTDSRKVSKEHVFFALIGERFDAFDFIDQVIGNGCRCIIYQLGENKKAKLDKIKAAHTDLCLIGVEDVLVCLQQLSRRHARDWQSNGGHLIALTGSNGKTTTKEMLGLILREVFPGKVQMTAGNLNNHIGVPLTLLNLKKTSEIAVVEMGMSGEGEIGFLCELAHPRSGLITNIGTGHIEFLKTREGILKEKASLLRYILERKDDGLFLLNTDDEYLKTIDTVSAKVFRISDNGERLFSASFNRLELRDGSIIENPHFFGEHLYHNLGMALSLLLLIFPKFSNELISSARSIELPKNNRAQWMTSGDTLVFLDAYNANPNSMSASLKSYFSRVDHLQIDRKEVCLILGDMNELGELAEQFHKEVGELVSSFNAGTTVFVGRYYEHYLKGCPRGVGLKDKVELEEWLARHRESFRSLFIKGSRSLQLESIVAIV